VQLADLLREVRRQRGLSIRATALRCDVPRSTWADWESGRSVPSFDRIDEVLAALHLDLRLVPRAVEPEGEAAVRRHLRRSLTQRAGRALGEHLECVVEACRQAPRLLTGPAAAGVWVPHVVARGPLPLPRRPRQPGLVPLYVATADGRRPGPAFVAPPAQLVRDGLAEQWPALLTAARLLAQERPRDAAGRRLPVHRDPDDDRELHDLAQTLTWGGRGRMPVSPLDSRGWRLDGAATLDDVLVRQGLPPRNASRRGGPRR